MASKLNIKGCGDRVGTLIGGDVLTLITSGMYASPLAIYREYIQNAADSIASSGHTMDGKVEITVDRCESRVIIRDNGPGLSFEQAKRELIPIARSRKRRQKNRGFRGIGRLSGLAFGNTVTFLTRRNQKSPVTKVTWDGDRLRDGIDSMPSVEQAISHCVTVERIHPSGDNYPANFFEVQVGEISRYAATSILNQDAVRDYIGKVCPVPFGRNFLYTSHVLNLFEDISPPLTLNVRIDDEGMPITRPHQSGVCISESFFDKFSEFEELKIPALNGEYAAVGWVAHSSYSGAQPKKLGVRCIRARVGNIQIGNETVFDHLFSESRFNRWCVAEIHILDPRIVPNGRRDYFEPSAHLRNLENHLGAVCRKIERRCRKASQDRNRQRHFQIFIEKLEAAYDILVSGYLTTRAAQRFISGKLSEISSAREKYKNLDCADEIKRLDKLEKKLSNFPKPREQSSLKGVSSSDLRVYRKIFQILADISPSPREAKETIETILKYKPN